MYKEQRFHPGELLVQKQTDETDLAHRNSRAISDSIRPGMRPFIAQQAFVVAGSIDRNQDIWATMVFGEPGFAQAPNVGAIDLRIEDFITLQNDNLLDNLDNDPRIGLLFVEPSTRRRLRINGIAQYLNTNTLRVKIHEAYPNCPKYIQKREPIAANDQPFSVKPQVQSGLEPTREVWKIINQSDTFFVASANPAGDLDASHRGGPPGFVEILDQNTIRIPDYAGNGMYNTLGNIAINPRVGLVFFDFKNSLLQLTGRAKIRFDLSDDTGETGGTNLYWDLQITGWRLSRLPRDHTYALTEYSPHNPKN